MPLLAETSDVLKTLPDSEQIRLSQRGHERAYPKGSTLFRAEERADFVWLIKEGRVHLTHFSISGKTLTTCVLTRGDLFCCLSTLDRRPYPSDAVAATDSVAVRIPSDLFAEWMKRYPTFSQKALCYFCDRLRSAEQRGCLLQEPVRERVLGVLGMLFKKFGDTIPFTCREVAEMAGTTIETAIRTLGQLKKEKLIRASRAKITIQNPAKLRELLGV